MVDFDELVFAPEPIEPLPALPQAGAWKVLIVDDDATVREITRLVLGPHRIDGRPLELLEAANADEAIALFSRHPDIAMGLIDMVMEEPTAGLRVIDAVRNAQGNHKVRLVVRTGQPGHLPEERVVNEHAVNDFREKTELSAARLRSIATQSIRAFQEIDQEQADRELLAQLVSQLAETRVAGYFRHARGSAAVAEVLALRLGFSGCRAASLRQAALLHDLGLALMDSPEAEALAGFLPLAASRQAALQGHAAAGAEALVAMLTPEGRLAARLAYQHHERWDGAGYPQGLCGTAVDLECRLFAIANIIDAFLSPQAFRPPRREEELRRHLSEQAGLAYDPDLVECALAHFDELVQTCRKARERGPPGGLACAAAPG